LTERLPLFGEAINDRGPKCGRGPHLYRTVEKGVAEFARGASLGARGNGGDQIWRDQARSEGSGHD
jgi:hypothetical protein